MENETEVKWRNVWCNKVRPHLTDDSIPKQYRFAQDGANRAPGLYGGGFMGELLVCLLPEDSGDWFVKLATDAGCDGKNCRHSVPL